ncbi:40S ribosomal protein S12 [Cyphellophora attinorum]|uniref:40S ribosomal protein S12 n=1 Tax=Cyphellophora attinorum TaxID=1664694 RepID=A0A0N0NJY2_9EURO|nr:40S ribosomal protein S12 [Phialophora attinorum]KPI37179.1 40S ribosomal protein S12 [Phialophora attinorum]
MTEVAASGAAEDVTTVANSLDVTTDTAGKPQMATVKTEDTSEETAVAANDVPGNPEGEDGDSEAETQILSPEKKRNIVDSAPDLRPTSSGRARKNNEDDNTSPESSRSVKKRKRDASTDRNAPQSSGASSSPLSSPSARAQSQEDDSDASDTPRSAHIARMRRQVSRADSGVIDGSAQARAAKRRPSDIIPPGPTKHRTRGSVGQSDPSSEHRETRSATYPRQSSEDRSLSPRPSSSRRDHKRGASTQITSGDVDRKKRGRPPNINTRRNKSVGREDSSDDGEDSSPAPKKIALERFDSRTDHISPAKPSGTRKHRDKNGRTLLARACNNEDLERARVCMETRPEDLNVPDNAGNTPLQIAALEGFTDIVRFLLESGAEVDTLNIDKDSPLIDAVENQHFEVVELLLQHGANPRLANAKGDEPYDLVKADDEHYKQIRKLIADAKERDWTKRRKSSDHGGNGGSSRAASAASPRGSPPATGTRSPPASGLANRKPRTGRTESTRPDLLWQRHDQENLQRLAQKGNVQGVVTTLGILQKAEPAAVIAAAKAGHEEVLQLMLALGDADPDPDPQLGFKTGYNTPMLAAIGQNHIDVVKLLVAQQSFDPTKIHRGRTYFEISAERKGENWQKEHDILKDAFDKYASGKSKTKSPRKTRDSDRTREKRLRRSASPSSTKLRLSASPTQTHKSLPDKNLRQPRKDGKQGSPSLEKMSKEDLNVAVASDQEQTVHDKRGHKHRRSQSDMPVPTSLEAETTQRKRRLISGKEHRRSQSGAGTGHSDGSDSDIETKRGKNASRLKRNRSSASPEAQGAESERVVIKKRRTVLESSPEESRPAPSTTLTETTSPFPDVEMADESSQGAVKRSASPKNSAGADVPHALPHVVEEQDAPGEPDVPVAEQATSFTDPPANGTVTQADAPSQEDTRQEVAQEIAADAEAAEAKRQVEEKAAVERELAEKAAAEKAEAERQAAEKKAADKAEAERRAAEEAEVQRKLDEADAKRRAEEEAAARKKEQEEREERKRRELQRQQEEQIRLQHLEIERRRREAMPIALCTAAQLIDNSDPKAKSHECSRVFCRCSPFVRTSLDPPLLATKDLNLRNYTLIEKRPANEDERTRMWKVGRNILSFDFQPTIYNPNWPPPLHVAVEAERVNCPKFMNMAEVFWVKYSDFEDQAIRQDHLNGLVLRKQSIAIHIGAVGKPVVSSPPITAPTQANGVNTQNYPFKGSGFNQQRQTPSDGEEPTSPVPAADEVEIAGDAAASGGSMSVLDALKGVLKIALIHDGLARGLREASKALDRRQAHMCVLNEACEEEAYKKLVIALCSEHKIPLIKVPDGKQLGEWAGLCVLDREGNARKVVNCSCVVVKDWGEESQERSVLLNYFQSEQ